VTFNLTLNYDCNAANADPTFQATIKADICNSVSPPLDPSLLVIENVTCGSTIITMKIIPASSASDPSPISVVNQLSEQLADTSSPLLAGALTSFSAPEQTILATVTTQNLIQCPDGSFAVDKPSCPTPAPTPSPTPAPTPTPTPKPTPCQAHPCPAPSTCATNLFSLDGLNRSCTCPNLLFFNGSCVNNCNDCASATFPSASQFVNLCGACPLASGSGIAGACQACCPVLIEYAKNPCSAPALEANKDIFIAIQTNCKAINYTLVPNYLCVPCQDGMKNGNETDVDCGGACPTKCAAGLHCATKADCNGGECSRGGLCQPVQPPVTTTKKLGAKEYGIIVGVIGGVLLLIGFLCTWKWWIPTIGGDGAYESAVSYTAANHEGIEMEAVKSDRGVSVVDDRLATTSPTYDSPHEDDVYVS